MASPSASILHSCLLSIALFLLFVLLSCSLKIGHAQDRRETAEIHHHTVQVSSRLPATVCNPSTTGPNKKSSLKVVHRYGSCSPLNQDKANTPTAAQILSQDQSRIKSIQSRLAFNSGKTSFQGSLAANLPAQSGITMGVGNYFVTVGLGTPEVSLYLIFDTGSDLTWTQCQPCVGSCYTQEQPIFDPSNSITYSNITCLLPLGLCFEELPSATSRMPTCSSLPDLTCLYHVQYGDGSSTDGYFATEKLTLTSTDVIYNFEFGCGEKNTGLFNGTAGLLGLGRGPVSIVSQTAFMYGKFFSYCLPPIWSSTSGYLMFGNNGEVPSTVQFTPFDMNQDSSFYFITITAMSVDGQQLPIDPLVFSTPGFIIDSGTTITHLPPTAYSALRTAFQEHMSQYPRAPSLDVLDTCYDLTNYPSASIPTISFTFGGGITIDIAEVGIVYYESASQVCLAFVANSADTDVGIFGNFQQQTLDVVYDVEGDMLGLGPGGCS